MTATDTAIIIDVSAAQGWDPKVHKLIDWPRVAASGRVDGAIIKTTEGNGPTPDRAAVYNIRSAREAGLLIGAYHFAHPDTVHVNDPESEADFFVGFLGADFGPSMRALGVEPRLALDIEEARQIHAGPEFFDWVVRFCDRVQAVSGCECIIYTGGPFWDEHDGRLTPEQEARVAVFDLWIAAYTEDPSRFVRMTPWRKKGWRLHQKSGNTFAGAPPAQHYDGIVGEVDTSLYNGTRAEYRAWITPRSRTMPSPPLAETLPAPAVPPDVGFTEAGRPGFAYSGPILDDRATAAATPLRAGDGGDDHAPAPLEGDDLDVTKP